MRLRTWLLTGTSVAVLALAPMGAVKAQSAELQAAYQAYVDAQAAGADPSAALTALTELCIVEGYTSVDDCIAALAAAAQAAAQAEAEAAAAAQAQAEAEAAAAAQAQAEAEAAAAAQAQAEAEAAAAAQAQAEAAAAAQAEAEAAAAAAQAEADAAAAAQAEADAAAAAEQQFVNDLNAAVAQYQQALDLAAAGDYATAQPMAAEAAARITQLCTDNGYPTVEACIGQTLPPLPEPPAPETPAEQPAATTETPAEQPAAEAPATEAPAEQPATEAPAIEEPAEGVDGGEPPAEGPTDPVVQAQNDLQTAIELYNVGVTQLQNGDPDGQSTVDAANAQITNICTSIGYTDNAQCILDLGFTPLPPLPEVPVEQPAAETPAAELPGAEEAVTPEAVEVLPETVAPEEAAPVLDSAKDAASTPPSEATAPPAEPVTTEPPPTSDTAAQAELALVEVAPVAEVTGEALAVEALPALEVPQNVTVVNNITNVTNNTTNITNNNFTNSGFIFQVGVNLVISNPAQERDRYYDEDEDEVFYERLSRGRTKETIVRPNGVQIVTIRDRYGEVIRRSRIMPDGREFILAGGNDWDRWDRDDDDDDWDDDRDWRDPGDDLPPLRLTISVRDYILDADEADEEEVEEFFREPPVERVRRIYTIDEVKRSARIRDSVRRLEVGGLTFDSGAATISRSQVGALSKVANAMLALLEDNPAETFLIEGHTDAVGSEVSNLVLSDARAATVARILTDFYDIPPENLVTQGYGERYLKVDTDEAERLNRRVTIKRITPLITLASRD